MAPADGGERHSPTGAAPPPSGPDGFLNLTQLARAEGVTKAAVSKTVGQLREKAGLEVRAGKGREVLVDPAAYRAAKARLADLSRPQSLPLDRAPSSPTSGAAAESLARADKLQEAKLRQTSADAHRAELRQAKEAKQLCSVKKADATTADVFTTVRERLQALPAKVAAKIARMTDKRDIALTIRAAIDDTFDKIADDIEAGIDLIDAEDDAAALDESDDAESDDPAAAGE